MNGEMLAIAGYFPDLPPTPKPIGGPIPDRSLRTGSPPVHRDGVEKKRERQRRIGWWRTERGA